MSQQTRIFDEAIESRKRQLASQSAPPDIELELHRKNLHQSCLLGGYLFLQPEAVLTWCHYWLTQYSNYTLSEQDLLIDLVHQLMYNAPRLIIQAGEAMPLSNAGNHAMRCTHLLRFAGNGRCAIPLQYCQEAMQLPMLLSLSELALNERQSFLGASTDALDAELRLDSFVYDNVLQYFYEPSFLLLTLYRLHVMALLDAVENKSAYALTRHLHTVKALEHTALDWERVQKALSLTPQSMYVLQWEVGVLYTALDTTDLRQCLENLHLLWYEKASQCYAEREKRASSLLTLSRDDIWSTH
jgi:hypothetical protein